MTTCHCGEPLVSNTCLLCNRLKHLKSISHNPTVRGNIVEEMLRDENKALKRELESLTYTIKSYQAFFERYEPELRHLQHDWWNEGMQRRYPYAD